MKHYSTIEPDCTQEMRDFEDRLSSFFGSAPQTPIWTNARDCYGASDADVAQRELEEFERAMQGLEGEFDTKFVTSLPPDAEIEHEKFYPEPAYISPYEKCFLRVRALEARLAVASSDQKPQVEAELDEATAAWDIEKARSLDDDFRALQAIDRWRAVEGRDEYNASRRTRAKPNTSLRHMSDEERKAHRKAQKAASARKRRAEKLSCA